MTQQQLREYLEVFIRTLEQRDRDLLDARLQSLASVFPFNEYEYILVSSGSVGDLFRTIRGSKEQVCFG